MVGRFLRRGPIPSHQPTNEPASPRSQGTHVGRPTIGDPTRSFTKREGRSARRSATADGHSQSTATRPAGGLSGNRPERKHRPSDRPSVWRPVGAETGRPETGRCRDGQGQKPGPRGRTRAAAPPSRPPLAPVPRPVIVSDSPRSPRPGPSTHRLSGRVGVGGRVLARVRGDSGLALPAIIARR